MVIRNGMIFVSVSQENLDRAMNIAIARNDKKSASKKFEDGYDDLDIHYWGAIAEVAWEQITGWEIDDAKRQAGDSGIDFEHDERTYQMKTRIANSDEDPFTFKNPDLLCRLDYAKAERYILSEVDSSNPSRVTFVGWCTREELIETTITIEGKGERYIRYRRDLRPIPRSILRSHG